MGTNSKIEYVNHSLNFWVGCTPARPTLGCKHCYALREMRRYGRDPTKVVRTSRATWRQPLVKSRGRQFKWKSGDYVFVCSWSDFFHSIADQWRTEAWDLMRKRPDLIWVIVTKRIDRAKTWIPLNWKASNRILLATIENQEVADSTIPELLAVKSVVENVLACVSIEPMLGPIDLHTSDSRKDILWRRTHGGSYQRNFLRWIVCGAESLGSHPGRECKLEWVRDVIRQCDAAGVPVHIKQLHLWRAKGVDTLFETADEAKLHCGDGKVKRVLVKNIKDFPKDLQRQEIAK